MNKNFCITLLIFLLACNQRQAEQTTVAEAAVSGPNIIFFIADDLGYSDIGPFGGNINTPVLDGLAKESMLFSNFHVLPTCSPTRSVLLTGNDNHIAGLGIMGESTYPALKGLPGYTGHLSDQVATIPEILREKGYHTYMAGKWHLGDDEGQIPSSRGFEESFALLQGGGSHYADQKPLSPPQVMDYRVNVPVSFKKRFTDKRLESVCENK